MKLLTTIGLILLISMGSWAQVGVPVFRGAGNAVLDSTGNLVVFEPTQSSTGVTVTGLRRTFFPPETRITIQTPGTSNNVQTKTYNAGIEVIGTGTSAIFAIATTYTVSGTTVTTSQTLIAIKAGQIMLTGALSDFQGSHALTSPVEAKLGPNDYITLITETAPAAGSTTTTPTRTAQVLHFNGSSFDLTSSGMLP